jgi:hypothetical protein
MSFSPIGRSISRGGGAPISAQARIALALEAGTAHLRSAHPALAARVRLVSLRGGVLHAFATSAPAAHELRAVWDRLCAAMRVAAPVDLTEVRVEIRGTLDSEPRF